MKQRIPRKQQDLKLEIIETVIQYTINISFSMAVQYSS